MRLKNPSAGLLAGRLVLGSVLIGLTPALAPAHAESQPESEEALSGTAGNITEYEEWMIGGGYKIASGVGLGFYYAESEATRPHAADDQTRSGDISTLGVTLDLRF